FCIMRFVKNSRGVWSIVALTSGTVNVMIYGRAMTPARRTNITHTIHWRLILNSSPPRIPKKLGFDVCNFICSAGADVTAVLNVFLLYQNWSIPGRPVPGPGLTARWFRERGPRRRGRD